ncbi:MAG: exosortase/archaeosortase family protein [Candidatus Brocadiales bacterium]
MQPRGKGTFLINYWPALIITALLAYTYLDTFHWMTGRWLAADSYYSHGFVVPFISAYLVWKKRNYINGESQVDSRGTVVGLALLFSGIGLHGAGLVFKISFISGLSLLPLLLGMVLYIYGWQAGRRLLFPILFLLAMIPLPLSLIADLSLKLKLFAAEVAVRVVSFIGIAVLREGSSIHFSDSFLVVGDVCSGLRSLIALLAFGALFAYVSGLSTPLRAILFIASVPIALVANSVRIIVLCLIAKQWGSEVATGRVHDATGILIFIVAFILFFSLERRLHALEQTLFKMRKGAVAEP